MTFHAHTSKLPDGKTTNPDNSSKSVKRKEKIKISQGLTPYQLIGFLKDKTHLEYEREKTDRPLP